MLVVGDNGLASYTQLQEYVRTHRVARLLRAILVNPLVAHLPPLPVVVMGTCDTFDYERYLVPQWAAVEQMFKEAIGPLGFKFHGHSSDGDQRRRRAMLLHSRETTGTRYTVPAKGFTHSGVVDMPGEGPGVPVINLDQDYLHNIKKLWNVAKGTSRQLRMGDKVAVMGHLKDVVRHVPRAEHGIRQTDLDREGYKAMDVPSVLRVLTPKALRTLKVVERQGWGDLAPMPFMQGTIRFLELIRSYASIYLSRKLTHLQRIFRAAKVVTYLRLWREWVKHHREEPADYPQTNLRINYITREGAQDTIMSCHFVVLLIRLFRDHYPDKDIPYYRCGSDPCEYFFSSLGSFVMNKRTYTLLDAIQTVRTQLHIKLALGRGTLDHPWVHTRRAEAGWEEDESSDDEDDGNGDDDPPNPGAAQAGGPNEQRLPWPTDAEIEEAWNKGMRESYREATEDGMRPPAQNPHQHRAHARRYPDWWENPESGDPKVVAKRCEEDVLDEEVDDSGSDTGSDAEGCGDGADDDEEGGDDDGNPDARMPPVLHSLRQVLEDPDEVEVSHRVSRWMDVPGSGRKNKACVLSELTGCAVTVSADRGKRVQQTRSNLKQPTFNLATDGWVLRIGSDLGVAHTEGKAVVVCIGRVTGVRRRDGNGKIKIVNTNKEEIRLDENKESLGDVYLTMHWYTSKRAPGRQTPVFVLQRKTDLKLVHVQEVVAPATMTWNSELKKYELGATSRTIFTTYERKITSHWDPTDSSNKRKPTRTQVLEKKRRRRCAALSCVQTLVCSV